MIELKKQQEPTQEELNEWANQVYDYAIDLYTNQDKSWREVRQELISQGLDAETASTVVSNLKEEERKAKKNCANKEIGYGFLWAVGGVALTAITGGMFVFYGAVLWGAWLILKGIWHKMTL